MIGIDTDVLVRYLTQDDSAKARIANRAIEALTVEQPGYVSIVALAETEWELRNIYGFHAKEVTQVLRELVTADEIVVENPAVVGRAVDAAAAGAELADALIAETARQAGCEHTVTFDRRAAKAAGMQLLT